MKGDGRFYLACAVMLLALPGCTHGISAAVPLVDSYAMAVPNDDPSPGERGLREINADEGSTVSSARVYVISGQGDALTSSGMTQLAARLSEIRGLTVSSHDWFNGPNFIVNSIRQLPTDEPVILIGYSLGANATTRISHALPNREIALAIAYDPSIHSEVFPADGNVRRVLLYHNNGLSLWGHARIPGPQVETTEINQGHLSVDSNQQLHARTLEAVLDVISEKKDSYAMAVPTDDPSPGERDYRQADFGLEDPGVTVITADEGGSIPSYESRFFGAGTDNTRWVVDGYCNSACTMVLGTGRVCATPRAQFNFHGGYYKYFGHWNVITPQWTYQMYQHYPDDVKSWVDAHHAMDQIRLTTMRQPEVATYVPSCRTRAASDAVAASLPDR
jgi:hypothetical protein